MDTSYKKHKSKSNDKKRQKRIQLTQDYLEEHRVTNEETGEIRSFYPDNTRDRREKIAARKLGNLNSSVNRVYNSIRGNAYFYTINLADVRQSWADYGVIFNPKKANKIKNWLKKTVNGPFYAEFEVSSFASTHIHLVCRKQNPLLLRKILKAETQVYDEAGLLEYFSKPVINSKERHTEAYNEMVGAYLQEKAEAKKQGRRCAKRNFWRVKDDDNTTLH